MSKPSSAAGIAMLAAVSFWIGCQSFFVGYLAYSKFWLGEGEGYEAGLGGFLGGTILLGLFSAAPAAVFFIAVFIRGLLSRNITREHTVRLYVYSALLGLCCSSLFIGLQVLL